jgi:Ca-activated chloride channel family protein
VRRVPIVVCLIAAAAATIAAQQSPTVFRSATQMVPVYVTAVDENAHLVTDLTRDDFDILDNGRPQPISEFSNAIQPISIVIMLDMSGSMTGNLAVLRNAAVQMFTRLLPSDQARVGSFGDRITMSDRFTNDPNELIRTLWTELTPGGGTPLWAAINIAMTTLAHLEGRRVVLVLSDGKDTSDFWGGPGTLSPKFPEIVRRAQVEEYLLYAIGLPSRSGSRMGVGRMGDDEPDPGLRELAAETGGGYFELHQTDALGPTFARVADELHRQYLLGFIAPSADGKMHQITVTVKRAGVGVRARHSYLAPTKPTDR